jgi:hypothetical protein
MCRQALVSRDVQKPLDGALADHQLVFDHLFKFIDA